SLKRKELENRLLSIELGDRREKQELLDELNFLRSRDSLILAQRKQKVDSMRAINKGVPVIPFRDTVLVVYTTLGSYSAKERAAAVTTRIQHIAKRYDFDIDSLRI